MSTKLTTPLSDTVTFSSESAIGGVWFAIGHGIYSLVIISVSIGGVLRLVSGVEILLWYVGHEVEV